MKKIFSLIIISLFLFGMLSDSLSAEKIVIAGTGDSEELLRILAAAFEKANPGRRVEVPETIGSSAGIKAAAEGRCDLGRVARPLNEKEKLYDLNYQVFAYSPLVFVVHPSVKGVDSLTLEQLLGIFSGKITSWSELGGEHQKIYLAQREAGDSSRSILEEDIPGWNQITDFPGELIYSTPELVSTLARYQNTIGYAPLSMVKGRDLVVLKIAGVYPSVENVKNARYKLVVPFALVWKGQLQGLAKDFLDFIFSPQGQKLIEENGAVPLR